MTGNIDASPIADVLEGIIPPAGAYPCRGGCGQTTALPGLCDPCGAARSEREQNAGLRLAYASIPDAEFGWANADAPELAQRVSKLSKLPDIADRVRALAAHRMILIHGASGAGKTSLACAVLRTLVDAGRYPAKVPEHTEARRARFFAARSIAVRDHHEAADGGMLSPRVAVARASVALIDDVGQEAGEGFKSNERSKLLADVLSDRHDAGARTIVTTYADQEAWRVMYGDGVARRYWDASRVKVVRL